MPLLLFLWMVETAERKIPNNYSYKNQWLEANASTLNTIILGSSHSYCGVNPEYLSGKAFNASHVGQTLKFDHFIFDKFYEKFDQLEHVILPVSYFTLFSKLKEDITEWRIKNYNIYYSGRFELAPKYYLEIVNGRISYKIEHLINELLNQETGYTRITVTPLGQASEYVLEEDFDMETSGLEAANRHTKKDFRHLEYNVQYLEQIISMCAEKNIKLILFTPPALPAYRDHLDARQLEKMNETLKTVISQYKHVHYKSFLSDTSYAKSEYFDADHLNKTGAIKLSQALNQFIQEVSVAMHE